MPAGQGKEKLIFILIYLFHFYAISPLPKEALGYSVSVIFSD